jgi:hypothetical protein
MKKRPVFTNHAFCIVRNDVAIVFQKNTNMIRYLLLFGLSLLLPLAASAQKSYFNISVEQRTVLSRYDRVLFQIEDNSAVPYTIGGLMEPDRNTRLYGLRMNFLNIVADNGLVFEGISLAAALGVQQRRVHQWFEIGTGVGYELQFGGGYRRNAPARVEGKKVYDFTRDDITPSQYVPKDDARRPWFLRMTLGTSYASFGYHVTRVEASANRPLTIDDRAFRNDVNIYLNNAMWTVQPGLTFGKAFGKGKEKRLALTGSYVMPVTMRERIHFNPASTSSRNNNTNNDSSKITRLERAQWTLEDGNAMDRYPFSLDNWYFGLMFSFQMN